MEWQEIFTILITLIIGVLGSGLTEYFKNKLGWDEKAAVVLTGVIAAVLGALQIFLSGAFGFGDLTWETLPALIGLIFTAATLYYKLLKGSAVSLFGRYGSG
jgi:uncharacterized membrane protein YeaQ/YmgE (transglycosylase-associated protein family)